jgi:hypothetical protein
MGKVTAIDVSLRGLAIRLLTYIALTFLVAVIAVTGYAIYETATAASDAQLLFSSLAWTALAAYTGIRVTIAFRVGGRA